MAETYWDRKDLLKYMIVKGDTIDTLSEKIGRDRRNVYGWLMGANNSIHTECLFEEYFQAPAIKIRKAWNNKGDQK